MNWFEKRVGKQLAGVIQLLFPRIIVQVGTIFMRPTLFSFCLLRRVSGFYGTKKASDRFVVPPTRRYGKMARRLLLAPLTHVGDTSETLSAEPLRSHAEVAPSLLTYHHRFNSFHFHSLSDLVHAPYAPSSLIVIQNILSYLQQAVSCVNSEQSESSEAKARLCARCLSSPFELQRVLEPVVNHVKSVLNEKQTMGSDQWSTKALQRVTREISSFADAIHAYTSFCSTTNTGWPLPLGTRVILFRSVLSLSSALGLHVLAVEAFQTLQALEEEAFALLGRNHRNLLLVGQGSSKEGALTDEDEVSLDSVVDAFEHDESTAEMEALYYKPALDGSKPTVEVLQVSDYVLVIQSCVLPKEFDLALAFFLRLQSHMEKVKKESLSAEPPHDYASFPSDDVITSSATPITSFQKAIQDSLIALAQACRNHENFKELRSLMVQSEAAAVVPVSVSLYTALIGAVGRSVVSLAEEMRFSPTLRSRQESGGVEGATGSLSQRNFQAQELNVLYQKYLSLAFSFYRQLRDVGLIPNPETYTALIQCCAYCKEPTHAFAFFHEARAVCCGPRDRSSSHEMNNLAVSSSFPPSLYTALISAYSYSGYAADAKATLEVLAEAGAPLERSSFHAALGGSLTLREGREILSLMSGFDIAPTPETYAYLLQAVRRGGQRTKANKALHSSGSQPLGGVPAVLQLYDLHQEAMHCLGEMIGEEGKDDKPLSAEQSDGTESISLERALVERFPTYVMSLTQTLLHVRVDTEMDPRLAQYLKPLIRVAQMAMNVYTGSSPQCPTYIPPSPSPRASSLCVAVLAGDVLANLDSMVKPFMEYYSIVVIPFSAVMAMRNSGGFLEEQPVHAVEEGQRGCLDAGIQEVRQRKLQTFIRSHEACIHLMSLEEEMRWSRDVHRYGVPRRHWLASAAAVALNLARTDVAGGTKLYAKGPHPPLVVLVSSQFYGCGRYLIDFKNQVREDARAREDSVSQELQAAVARTFYHNPYTQPHWQPPSSSSLDVKEEDKSLYDDETLKWMGKVNERPAKQGIEYAEASRFEVAKNQSAASSRRRKDNLKVLKQSIVNKKGKAMQRYEEEKTLGRYSYLLNKCEVSYRVVPSLSEQPSKKNNLPRESPKRAVQESAFRLSSIDNPPPEVSTPTTLSPEALQALMGDDE